VLSSTLLPVDRVLSLRRKATRFDSAQEHDAMAEWLRREAATLITTVRFRVASPARQWIWLVVP
jgi:hypothetical protein